MDAALLLHHRDIFYYAGTVRPAALLVSPRDSVLFVRRGFEQAQQEATLSRVEPMRGFSDIAAVVTELGLTGSVLGVELDLVSVRLYRRLQETFGLSSTAIDSTWSLVDISPLVMDQRMIKDEEESALARRAAAVADAGHIAAAQTIAPGVSELALAAEVEAAIRRVGHDGFQPLRHPGARGAGVLLMSGEHLTVRGGHGLVVTGVGLGPAMPYGPSRRKLEVGDLVVVDIGSTYAGYTGDESRTFVVGPATEAQQALFAVARATEDAVLGALRPGFPVADLYPIAEAVVASGAPPYFAPGSLTLPGFVGHGIGLELDEPPVLWPRAETKLQAGMTLAIEIEVSALEQGSMVKLEDTVLLQPDGYEMLTDMPRELIVSGE